MMKMINTVIFDMDGLMFDTESLYIEVFENVCQKKHVQFPRKYLINMLGTSDFDLSIYNKDYPWIEQMLEQADNEFDDYFNHKFKHAGSANKLGLKELYDYLKLNGYKICIASSSSLEHIHQLVDYCGFDFKADVIVSARGMYPSKPAPDVFLACAKKLKVNPKNCVVLEDSRHGIHAAYNAGMHRVWIPDQVVFTKEDMQYVEYKKENLLGVIELLEAI